MMPLDPEETSSKSQEAVNVTESLLPAPDAHAKSVIRTSKRKKRPRTKPLEWATFVVIPTYTLISGLQWGQIKETNRLTREALRSGDYSLKQTLNKMQAGTDATKGLVGQAGLQVQQLGAAARQTTRLAEATEATNTNVVNADRPWFGADIEWTPIEVGTVLRVSISFKNSGRRPAYITEYKTEGHRFEQFPKDPPFGHGRGGKDFVVPGEAIGGDAIAIFGEAPLTSALVQRLDASPWKEYIYADLEYRDSLTNESHHTHVCVHYLAPTDSTKRGLFNCETYNEGN